MSGFFKFVANPVDALLFQPPTPPTYSTQTRGTLDENCRLVNTVDGDFAVVIGMREESELDRRKVCLVWVHGNACDCGQESAGLVTVAQALNVVIVAVECKLIV